VAHKIFTRDLFGSDWVHKIEFDDKIATSCADVIPCRYI